MASIQSHKPSEETNHQVHTLTSHQKTTTEIEVTYHQNKHNNDHSFTNKMKEMVQSTRKMFNHQDHHMQNPSGTAQGGTKEKKTKKKKKKTGTKPEESEGHCMPKMHEHMKNLKKKMHREEKHSGSSSSSSESESENNERKNKAN